MTLFISSHLTSLPLGCSKVCVCVQMGVSKCKPFAFEEFRFDTILYYQNVFHGNVHVYMCSMVANQFQVLYVFVQTIVFALRTDFLVCKCV